MIRKSTSDSNDTARPTNSAGQTIRGNLTDTVKVRELTLEAAILWTMDFISKHQPYNAND